MNIHTLGPLSILTPKRTGGELGDAGDRGIQTSKGILVGEAWTECPGPGGTKHIVDAESTARLWSAAPDLLDALKGLTRIVEGFSYSNTLGKTQMERLEAARAAIAKATTP